MGPIDPKATAALQALLDKANGKRRKFLLAMTDVERVIADAVASPHGIAVRHGGAELLAKTTMCLGVVPPKKADTVVVGIGLCGADRPTPGRLWKELQPWQQDVAKNAAKAHAWAAAKAADRVAVRPGKARAAPAGDGAALLAEILANPTIDGPRLVYADHLIAAGDPRGELIAVQCALAKAKAGERRKLLAREKELLAKHRAKLTREAMQVAIRCELARGFVAKIEVAPAAFAQKGAALLAHEPIEEVSVVKATPAGLEALGKAAHVARVRRLITGVHLQRPADVAKTNAFLRSKHVAQLRELELGLAHDRYISEMPDASGLFAGVALSVERLVVWLHADGMGAAGIAQIVGGLAAAELPALRQLTIRGVAPAQRTLLGRAFPKAKVGT